MTRGKETENVTYSDCVPSTIMGAGFFVCGTAPQATVESRKILVAELHICGLMCNCVAFDRVTAAVTARR